MQWKSCPAPWRSFGQICCKTQALRHPAHKCTCLNHSPPTPRLHPAGQAPTPRPDVAASICNLSQAQSLGPSLGRIMGAWSLNGNCNLRKTLKWSCSKNSLNKCVCHIMAPCEHASMPVGVGSVWGQRGARAWAHRCPTAHLHATWKKNKTCACVAALAALDIGHWATLCLTRGGIRQG